MTSNQLKLREIREKERSNKVYESIESGKLAETIHNNLRNYHVNVDKNEIQKLANDQLDARERAKLAETIRDNLTKEIETNRHNLADEEIKRMKNAIDSLKTKYDTSTLIAAAIGIMPKDEIINLYGDEAYSGLNGIKTLISNYFNSVIDDHKAEIAANKQRISGEGGKASPTGGGGYSGGATSKIPDPTGSGPQIPNPESGGTRGTNKKKKKKEENEIPTDFSSSYGPAVSSHTGTEPSNGSGASSQASYVTPSANFEAHPTSGGTDYSISGGHKSSGVIYAPTAN